MAVALGSRPADESDEELVSTAEMGTKEEQGDALGS